MIPTAEQQRSVEPRAVCYRCHKPVLTCICSRVRQVHNRTPVWVAQHPRERFHPLGTARFARLGLADVHVEVVAPRSQFTPSSLPTRAGLLYPGSAARDLATVDPDERPDALVVIDGTWAQAHTLYRGNRWLQRLPHYRLTPRRQSRYRLRKEPAADCVSTIEAIVEALRILEPDTPHLDDLLASFDSMIDQQIALIHHHRRGPRRREASRSHRGLPLRFFEEAERLVVVGLEAAPRSTDDQDALAIIQCVALRFGTGEVFQHFVRPPADRFPDQHHLAHMRLGAERLREGSAPGGLPERWQRFIDHGDIVVGWNRGVLDGLAATVGLPAGCLHLKSAYRSHAKHARGSLAAVVRRLGLEPPALPELEGRAGEHVAHVAALLTHLQSPSRHGTAPRD